MNKTVKTAVISFLAVFVIVVAAGGVVGFVMNDDTTTNTTTAPEHVEIENPQWDADRVASNRTPGTASVEMDSSAFQNKVVVHVGGSLTERAIAPLVNALVEGGHEVTVVAEQRQRFGGGPIVFSQQSVRQVGPPPGGEDEAQLTGELDDAHGLISIGVSSYNDQDLEAIDEFVKNNGRVVMAVEPSQEFSFGEGHSQTYSNLGVYTEPGYVYNLEENDLNYQRIFAEPSGDSMLTEGVERAVFPSATPVQAINQNEGMLPIEGSELSVTRAETDKPVLVRDKNVALVGDTDFLRPENTQRVDNDVLVGNIADFLVEANRNTDDSSGDGAQNSTETVTVEVGPDGENMFSPEVTEIEPGTTVKFVWKSGGHNIVPTYQEPTDADWNGVPETQEEGFVHEYTFEEEGVHEFVSEPHQDDGMYGVIVVGDP
jgi:plastocyanin